MAEGIPIPPGHLATLDQARSVVQQMATSVVDHWEICPTQPREFCIGGGIGTYIDALPLQQLRGLLGTAVAELARIDYDRRHPDDAR